MPVKYCTVDNKPGFQWSDEGKCYTYTPNDDVSIAKAKQKALQQAIAISSKKSKPIADTVVEFKETYNDYPQAATENAKIALRWAEKNGWGSCGTAVGKRRANQLAQRQPISRDTIARMSAFERHRQNSEKPLGDGCGRLMWLAWGGDEGIAWAKRKLEQIDNK